MALTDTQAQELEFQTELEAVRAASMVKQHKMEALRIAQTIVFENRRLLTASEAGDITVSDVTTKANEILTFING